MSADARDELLRSIRPQYKDADRKKKQQLLNGFVAATGLSRKHAISLLTRKENIPATRTRTRKYDDEVAEALHVVWKAANRICSKRLIPFLPELLHALERFGHISVKDDVRSKLLSLSPATADRILKTERRKYGRGRSLTKPGHLIKKQIEIRTFADWDDVRPGFLEADLVAHCGGSVQGQFLHTLTLTDIETGWTELGALLRRSEADVLKALGEMKNNLPFQMLGLDTDNGSEFINYELVDWCQRNEITFTRSREYKKNDQAHVEEKNGSIVRRLIGYDRYEGLTSCGLLSDLYKVARLYINFFQPSLKLKSKERSGARVSKKYHEAQTPHQRVMCSVSISQDIKDRLSAMFDLLDPLKLLGELERLQLAFLGTSLTHVHQINSHHLELMTPASLPSPSSCDLPTSKQWRMPAAAHRTGTKMNVARVSGRAVDSKVVRAKPGKKTSLDAVTDDINEELGRDPSLTSRKLLNILMQKYPGRFTTTQRSTLHARVLAWRMAQLQVSQVVDSNAGRTFAVEPDWERLRVMLKEETTTRMLFWRKYKQENEALSLPFYQYSQFCRRFAAWLEANSKQLIEPDWEWVFLQLKTGTTRHALWKSYTKNCEISGCFSYTYNNYCRNYALWEKEQHR